MAYHNIWRIIRGGMARQQYQAAWQWHQAAAAAAMAIRRRKRNQTSRKAWQRRRIAGVEKRVAASAGSSISAANGVSAWRHQ